MSSFTTSSISGRIPHGTQYIAKSSKTFFKRHNASQKGENHADESLLSNSDLSSRYDATKITTPTALTSATTVTKREVRKVEKFARLPVWPAWNGVFIFLLSRIVNEEFASRVENAIGGRVCPNFFSAEETSPFLMLVHHCHTFTAWDPLRIFQKSFFPEGFPSHPHRGFVTVTYILKGGFVHRDSLGVKQVYGANDGDTPERRKHTQWLTTGAGLLHEEMFDIRFAEQFWKNLFKPSRQELYQLWVNLPSDSKMCQPKVELLGDDHETPTIVKQCSVHSNSGQKAKVAETKTIVICGEYDGHKASVEPASNLSIFHVQMDPGTTWSHALPQSYKNAILYMRQGSIHIGTKRIPPHYTAYLESHGTDLTVTAGDNQEADFLLLCGEPIEEPVAARGSMVMNYDSQIEIAYDDYQKAKMGRPWSENLGDEEWMDHVKQFPSIY